MDLHFIGVDDQGFAKLTVEQIEKIYKDAYKAGFEHGKLESAKRYIHPTLPEYDFQPKIYC